MGLLSFFLNKLYKRKLGKLVSVHIAEQCGSSSPSAPHAPIPLSNPNEKPKLSLVKELPENKTKKKVIVPISAGKAAFDIIRRWESFHPEPYLCPAKIPTIGYGTTFYPDGTKVTMQDPDISMGQAEMFMRQYVQKFIEPQLTELVGDLVNRNQYDALVSFIYNIGMGPKKWQKGMKEGFRQSTLLKKILAGDMTGAAAEFPRWRFEGGRELAGLIARRKEERTLFETDPNI